MNGTRLYRAIGELDGKWFELAEQGETAMPSRSRCKMILIGAAAVLVLAMMFSVLAYNNRPLYPAVPGDAALYISATDCLFIPGYSVQHDAAPELKAFGRDVDDSYQPPKTKAVTFHGKTYQTTYYSSYNLNMRRRTYGVYRYKDAETGEMGEFYFTRDKNEKIIGYQIYFTPKNVQNMSAKSQAELIDIARSALGEFTDVEYYSEIRISNGPYGTYDVNFYNMIGDIEVADSSFVRIDSDGRVIEVKALPEHDILKAAHFSGLDSKEFDAALDARLREDYVDYHCDDENILADVKYSGMKVEVRMLSLDDNGDPVVLYLVRPQLAYEYTYRGEYAEIAAEKGLDIHESGIHAPPVYAAVRAE